MFAGSLPSYSTINRVPAATRAQPTILLAVKGSWRNTKASTRVITTLSLSMDTTCEARQLMVSSVAAISQMIDEKDRYTSEHSHRVAEYARLIGAHMGFAGEELDSLYRSALLHDIGKIAVPDAILNKPSRLTDEEFDIMKQHTVWGRKILEGLEFLPQADCGASYHHERFDGKGYPAGLKGGQLPEMVWIISVADALDAMGSDRCYRGHCDRDYIIGEFRKLSGTQFEPAAVKALVELLESGEIAVQ